MVRRQGGAAVLCAGVGARPVAARARPAANTSRAACLSGALPHVPPRGPAARPACRLPRRVAFSLHDAPRATAARSTSPARACGRHAHVSASAAARWAAGPATRRRAPRALITRARRAASSSTCLLSASVAARWAACSAPCRTPLRAPRHLPYRAALCRLPVTDFRRTVGLHASP